MGHFRLWLLAPIALFSSSANAEHYRIWVKSFIPNSGLDIVVPVPNADGRFMLPGPHIAGIPIDSTCYNTNDRSFSDDVDAEAKISLRYDFDVLAPGIANVSSSIPPAGETLRYDCATGAILATGQATTDDLQLGEVEFDGGVVRFSVDGDAANPLISLPNFVVPSIKVHGTMTLDTNKRSISFSGTVAKFPSYEGYLSVDGGPPVPIFKISPESDATVWSLMLDRPVDVTVAY